MGRNPLHDFGAVPVLHMIGSRPAMMATTVIIFGRTRFERTYHDGGIKIVSVSSRPSAPRRAPISAKA